MEAQFRVIGDSYNKPAPLVDAEVRSPLGKSVTKVELKSEGRLNFVPTVDGTHSFCFRQHQVSILHPCCSLAKLSQGSWHGPVPLACKVDRCGAVRRSVARRRFSA